MKKGFIIILFGIMTNVFAMSATQNMPVIYNKNDTYPTNGSQAVKVITSHRGCLINRGETVNKLDSSFSMYKVISVNSGCSGWAPKEFFRF